MLIAEPHSYSLIYPIPKLYRMAKKWYLKDKRLGRQLVEWYRGEALRKAQSYNERMRIDMLHSLNLYSNLVIENAEKKIVEILRYSIENGKGLAMMAKLKTNSDKFYNSGIKKFEFHKFCCSGMPSLF